MLKVDSFPFFRQYLVEKKYNNSDTHCISEGDTRIINDRPKVS